MSNNCVKPNDELVVDIFIHSIILVLILSGVFWGLIAPLEKKNFKKEINSQVENAVNQYVIKNKRELIKNTNPQIDEINEKLNLLMRFYDSEDETTTMYNEWLYRVNIIIIVLMLISFIILLLVLKYNCKKCVPVMTIFFENIILFACIGVIEYLFFINIATKYVPVKPSYMATRMFSDIKNELGTQTKST